MPKSKYRGRGGVKRYRTKRIPGHPDEYLTCAVVGKAGPRGGKTVCTKKRKKR